MQNSKEQRPNLPLIGVVLLMAAASGYYFYGKPFESSRPRGGMIETSSTLGPQSVPARLWEDPFTAVSNHQAWEQQPDPKGRMGMFQMFHYPSDHSLTYLKDQIGENVKEHNKVTIMPVMVFGGPYAEDIEQRRRRRYAVLSALTVSGYRAIDPEHIDYFQIPWDPWLPASNANKHAKEGTGQCPLNQSLSMSSPSKGCLVIPYEWLVPIDKGLRQRPDDSISEQHGAVLLLWLDDNLFEDQPLSRLERLIEKVGNEPKNNLSFKIIGPAGSTTLQEMVREAFEKQSQALARLKSSEIEIYSATATASSTLLLPENETKTPPQKCPPVGDKSTGEMGEAEKAIEKAFCTLGIKFRRTIPTDYELACSLREELDQRGVKQDNPNHHIALIAEWDTFYGRSLPTTFSTVFEERRNRSGSTSQGEEEKTWEAECRKYGICHYSYMRGLDGEIPLQEKELQEKEAAKTSKRAAEIKRDLRTLERAVGDSQFDYLRRLAANLERLEREIHWTGRHLQAIGVLGSDVYDKLLILQALHAHFPKTLFFTTDLDARYLHPVESEWSRNLIVGSGFGLELHLGWQRDVPPFRDSYQTAVFFATQVALGKKYSKGQLSPRLFEIGRNQPIDLSVDPDPDAIHPPPVLLKWQDSKWRDSTGFIIKIVAAVALALWLLGMLTWISKRLLILSGIVVIAPIVFISALVTLQGPEGEPFDLLAVLAGVSLWPSEAIRLYALFLAWWFIWQGYRLLRDSTKELSTDYCLDGKVDPPVSREGASDGAFRHHLRAFLSKCLSPWRRFAGDQGSEKVSVQQLWAWYRESSRGWPTFWRVLVASMINFLVWILFLIISSGEPLYVPYRGEISFWSDKVILWFAVLSLIGLIFFVVDVTRLCCHFIVQLSQKPSQWPPKTLEKFAIKHGMSAHPDDLSEWLDIRLIGERTHVVRPLIYYPLIVLLFMIVARSPLFDRWELAWELILVFGLNAAYITGCVVALRSVAKKARQRVLDMMNQKLSEALENGEDRVKQIRLLIEEVEANREGAFRPLSEEPAIGAILFLLGGSGGLVLLEYLV